MNDIQHARKISASYRIARVMFSVCGRFTCFQYFSPISNPHRASQSKNPIFHCCLIPKTTEPFATW